MGQKISRCHRYRMSGIMAISEIPAIQPCKKDYNHHNSNWQYIGGRRSINQDISSPFILQNKCKNIHKSVNSSRVHLKTDYFIHFTYIYSYQCQIEKQEDKFTDHQNESTPIAHTVLQDLHYSSRVSRQFSMHFQL